MNIKLASVFLFLALVTSSYGFYILETYADANCNETIVARFITNDDSNCGKRRALLSNCFSVQGTPGVYYAYGSSSCSGTATEPELPAGWQSVAVVGSDPSCNTSAVLDYRKIQAPQSLEGALVVVYDPLMQSNIPANISMACNIVNGAVSFSFCFETQLQVGQICVDFTLETSVCTIDSANSTYAIQSTCVAVPMAAPVANHGPVSGPIAAPVATPTAPSTAPTKAPTSKTSSGSIIVGSFSLLALFALI